MTQPLPAEELRHLPIELAARYYVECGLAIVPLIGKNPEHYGRDWWGRAITDPTEAMTVFAGDSRWTNIGWAQGYGTVAVDVDHADKLTDEMRQVCMTGALNPTRPGRGHRIFATDGLWSASTGGFPSQGWGEVRAYGGQVVIWGPHPEMEGHRYCYDPRQQVPPAPPKLLEWLSGRGAYESSATAAEVSAFHLEHSTDERPGKLTGVERKLAEYLDSGIAIHESFVKAAPWLAREVVAGHYSADRATEFLREQWNAAWIARQGENGRQMPHREELAGIWRWAIAQASTEPTPATAADATPEDDTGAHRLAPFLIEWGEFWATDHDGAEWVLEPLFAVGRGHAIYAGAKTGKSYVVLAACAALATGRPFLHHPGGDPVDVLYVDYEMTDADLRDRLEEFGYGPDDDLSHLHYALLPSIEGLDTPEGGQALVGAAVAVGAQLVIIDTTGRAVEGEENAADTVRAFYRHTGLHLKQRGVAFARIDHAGKDADKGQRGTSAKNDDVDIVVRMTNRQDGKRLTATHRRMSWYPEQTDIQIVEGDDGVTRFAGTAPMWPDGTSEVVALLDELGVPLDATVNTAQAAMRAAKAGRRRAVVASALRFRQHSATTEAVDNLVDNSALESGNRPGTASGNRDRETSTETPNLHRETPPEPLGTAVRPGTGTDRISIEMRSGPGGAEPDATDLPEDQPDYDPTEF